jgi:ankyrin repeat protein
MIKKLTASYGRALLKFFFAVLGLCAGMPATILAAADPVTARKNLKETGVDYTEQQFAKSAGEGDMTAVNLFLEAGMDVNAGGGAALGLAAGRGQLEMVKLLLSKGAKPTSNSLQFARTRGHAEIEKILVEAGAKE